MSGFVCVCYCFLLPCCEAPAQVEPIPGSCVAAAGTSTELGLPQRTAAPNSRTNSWAPFLTAPGAGVGALQAFVGVQGLCCDDFIPSNAARFPR